MKNKTTLFLFFLLLLVPLVLMLPVEIRKTAGGELETAGYATVNASGAVLHTKGASAFALCWKENFWEKRRDLSFGTDWAGSGMLVRRRRLSPYLGCAEFLRNSSPARVFFHESLLILDPLPERTLLSVKTGDGAPVEILADASGNIKLWLFSMDKIRNDFPANILRLIERGSQFKPFSSRFGLILFAIWPPLLLLTARAIIRWEEPSSSNIASSGESGKRVEYQEASRGW